MSRLTLLLLFVPCHHSCCGEVHIFY